MNRYNIDTENDDLIQIDIDGSWTVEKGETAMFCIVRMEYPSTKQCTIGVTHKDLVQIRDTINRILGDTN
ncbi:hypothetical protein EBZ39_14920 [bacterium]|nr:hypothetical protein [bacterium]